MWRSRKTMARATDDGGIKYSVVPGNPVNARDPFVSTSGKGTGKDLRGRVCMCVYGEFLMFGIRCGDGICCAKVSHNKNTPAKCSAAGPTTGRGTGIIPRVLFAGSEAVGHTVQLKFPYCALFARVHGRPYFLFATRMFERYVFKTHSRRRCRFRIRPANKRDPKFGSLSSTTLVASSRPHPWPLRNPSVYFLEFFFLSHKYVDGVRQRMTYVVYPKIDLSSSVDMAEDLKSDPSALVSFTSRDFVPIDHPFAPAVSAYIAPPASLCTRFFIDSLINRYRIIATRVFL